MPAANARGLAYVPADRKREGGAARPLRSHFNLLLPALARRAGLALAPAGPRPSRRRRWPAQLTIRGDLDRPVQALSGGNQQKVALAKWLPLDPRSCC